MQERADISETIVSSLPLWDFKLWKKALKKNAPLSFWLEVTARCNNNCRQCYVNVPEEDCAAVGQGITLEEIKRIVDEAASLGCLSCLLTGGEPLIRKDFSDIYSYLKQKGLSQRA